MATRAGRSPGSVTRVRCRGSSSGSTSPIGSITDAATASATHYGGHGPLTDAFLKVLKAWGPDALPALPEVVALLDDAGGSLPTVEVLAAMGPGAASAELALRAWKPLNWSGYQWKAAWAASHMGGDRTAALRLIGDAVLTEEGPYYGPVHLLADFGTSAAPYADRVRHIMENTGGFRRIEAALALWSGTGEPEPSISVRERNYEAFLQDEELRAAIEYLFALP